MALRSLPLTDAGLIVQKPGNPASRFTVPLPGQTDSGGIVWLSPTRLMHGGADHQLCDIAARRCKDYSKADTK